MGEKRSYKIFTDGRKNMMTIPTWTDFKTGEEVLVKQVGDFLLVMRARRRNITFSEKGEALRGLIDAFLNYHGLQAWTSPLLERVVESFNIMKDETSGDKPKG